jgi:hypothetical protein
LPTIKYQLTRLESQETTWQVAFLILNYVYVNKKNKVKDVYILT